MDIDSTKLTVFFEAPFWIGVFERIERRKLSVCKVVFGAEPKDYEVWEYLLKNYSRLRFSPSVETVEKVFADYKANATQVKFKGCRPSASQAPSSELAGDMELRKAMGLRT